MPGFDAGEPEQTAHRQVNFFCSHESDEIPDCPSYKALTLSLNVS
jgi:hypothetical protein